MSHRRTDRRMSHRFIRRAALTPYFSAVWAGDWDRTVISTSGTAYSLLLGIAVGAVMILCFEGLLRLTRGLIRKYANPPPGESPCWAFGT